MVHAGRQKWARNIKDKIDAKGFIRANRKIIFARKSIDCSVIANIFWQVELPKLS